MAKNQNSSEETKVAEMLQNLLAIELWRGGLSQAEIGKKLGIATGSVNKMLKGVSREIVIMQK